jgi:hypothetical protein
MKWQGEADQIEGLTVLFPESERSDALPVVKLLLRTGEVLTLNELSLSSQPLPVKTGFVASATLGTAALTQLLLSWTEKRTQTIAGQPKTSMLFLMTSSVISETWADMACDVLDQVQRPRRKNWSRNN